MGVRQPATRARGSVASRARVPVRVAGMPEARVPEAPDRPVPGRRQAAQAACST
ncbi:hypothetical protein [Desulforudis sp. Tu-874]|uniref:hypothetical protein n=1 Tax=Desulforudis sp. Tu-874 TaxID=3416276 RepID=UPI003CE4BC41